MAPAVPYLVTSPSQSTSPAFNLSTLGALPPQQRLLLSGCASCFGELTLPLAHFYERHLAPLPERFWRHTSDDGRALLDALVGASGAHRTGFIAALSRYQLLLEQIRAGTRQRMPKHQLNALYAQANQAWQSLNRQFRSDLQHLAGEARSRRGTVWTDPQRAINIATSGRSSAPIQLTNTADARAIVRFAGGLKHAGSGIVVIDAGVRTTNVISDYKAGKDWQRRAAIETAALGASTAAAATAANAAIAATTIVLGATPVGWVIAIGIGIGAAYLASKYTNDVVTQQTADLYDRKGWFSGW